MPNEAHGVAEVNFKTEKAFKVFGREYAKCYASMSWKGKVEYTDVSGRLSYQLRFHGEGGCDTFLGAFKKAYDKTFENYDASPEELVVFEDSIDDRDFTAKILACGVSAEVHFDGKRNLLRANAYFTDDDDGSTQNEGGYIDSDGLIQFIVTSELAADQSITDKLVEYKDNLVAMSAIATNHMNKQAEKEKNPAVRQDPKLWAEVLGHLPCMGPSKYEEKTYEQTIIGVEIASKFLNFIMDSVVSPGTGLDSFRKFLADEGEAIRFGVENNKNGYKAVTVGVVSEALKVGNTVTYIPKLRMYYIEFSRENYSFTSACASAQKVKINFKFQQSSSVFDYKALSDPEIRQAFDKFINFKRKAQIEDSNTYFEDDFITEDSEKLKVHALTSSND